MDDINVPTHETHLQVKDGLIGTVVRQYEFDRIAVGYPDELAAVTHVFDLVHRPITCKPFAKA